MEGALDVSEWLTCLRVSKHVIIRLFPATHLEQDLTNFRVQDVHRDFTILFALWSSWPRLHSARNLPDRVADLVVHVFVNQDGEPH
jgi:hypothetical protein